MWSIIVLIVLCCLVEGVLSLGDAGLLDTPRLRAAAYEYAGFWPGLMRGPWRPNYAAQPWLMFCTYAFLHSGVLHLLVNMVTLWSLGQVVVQRIGTMGFLLLYAAAVLGGGLGFGLLAQTTQPMVGASGGLFGLLGGILAWNYVDRFSAARTLWPVALWVTGLLALNVVQWWAMDGLLAWQAHLGGFVAGWITALLIDPRARPAPPQL
jgi:membrane associated rhomboid family serine protease